MRITKKETLIFLLILAAAACMLLFRGLGGKKADMGTIRITVDGEVFGEYALNKDQRIDINGTNTCRIKDGAAKMLEASCPDHLCIHQPAIDSAGGMIICLPNKVFIEGLAPEGAQTGGDAPDAVAN